VARRGEGGSVVVVVVMERRGEVGWEGGVRWGEKEG